MRTNPLEAVAPPMHQSSGAPDSRLNAKGSGLPGQNRLQVFEQGLAWRIRVC
jgi:hypothetical protein